MSLRSPYIRLLFRLHGWVLVKSWQDPCLRPLPRSASSPGSGFTRGPVFVVVPWGLHAQSLSLSSHLTFLNSFHLFLSVLAAFVSSWAVNRSPLFLSKVLCSTQEVSARLLCTRRHAAGHRRGQLQTCLTNVKAQSWQVLMDSVFVFSTGLRLRKCILFKVLANISSTKYRFPSDFNLICFYQHHLLLMCWVTGETVANVAVGYDSIEAVKQVQEAFSRVVMVWLTSQN